MAELNLEVASSTSSEPEFVGISLCAYGILEELTKLPENVYIKEYIDILEGYLR